MRLWLRDSERRPDPVPVPTDDRRAILVGLGLWVIALIVALVLVGSTGNIDYVWTCVVGLVLGLIGLIYTVRLRRR